MTTTRDNEQNERLLDVRPVVAANGDAFRTIVEFTRTLRPDETLHLITPFDPRPLYATLRSFRRVPRLEERDDAYHVRFCHDPEPAGVDQELAPPVTLDVRGADGPTATRMILEALHGPGSQLVVRADREPEALHEKLVLRGYELRKERSSCDGELLHVAPAWARSPSP